MQRDQNMNFSEAIVASNFFFIRLFHNFALTLRTQRDLHLDFGEWHMSEFCRIMPQ